MNVYVETNFVLELVFQQEQSASCQELLALGVAGDLRLLIPAYSLIEPYEKLVRQRNSRKALQRDMDIELNQLARTVSYQKQLRNVQKSTYKGCHSSAL